MARRRSGTGPRNFSKTPGNATVRVRVGVRASRAGTPRMSPGRANAGYSPPRAAGGGSPKVTTPMAGPPRRSINRPKTGRPRAGLGRPRADFPSKI